MPSDAQKDFIGVRLAPDTKRAIEKAAAAEEIPISTWIRNQIVASLYLSGVQEAPQVIYQGFRHSIQDLADNLQEVTLAVRAWPSWLETAMAAGMIAGGMDPIQSTDLARHLVADAITQALHPPEESEG